MKTSVIAICLCIFFFLVPLQFYIIGNTMGLGIQGAVYRFQITAQGNSLIPLPSELGYVTSGIYQGKTAYSVISWIIGTILLMIVTVFSLIRYDRLTPRHIKMMSAGVIGAGTGYLISCMFQYGVFFSGAAGISLPVGVIFMMAAAIGFYQYRDFFQDT
jgi:predicted PurR-regulated permease PerM